MLALQINNAVAPTGNIRGEWIFVAEPQPKGGGGYLFDVDGLVRVGSLPPLRCVQFQGLGFRQGGLLGDSLDAKLVLKIGDDLLF